MPILAIDTASRWTALGIYDEENDKPLVEREWTSAIRQTVELAPVLKEQLELVGLRPSGLTGISVAIGPGSYTGLRIGLGVAQGLAAVHGMPIVGVPTHEIVAKNIPSSSLPLWVVVEAGRKRVLLSRFSCQEGAWLSHGEIINPTWEELFELVTKETLLAGEIPPSIRNQVEKDSMPFNLIDEKLSQRSPITLARLGYMQIRDKLVPAQENLTPRYLRNP
ncbi:MAG: tRNA (adenosine(37)-N6)-threonylcarbamoyltransferase complex dimerization subunit type 1 TsaB [Chloroflexota bacterium]